MTSSIEVTEEMIAAGQKVSRERHRNAPVHAEAFREIYLAMKAADPLQQGDVERAERIADRVSDQMVGSRFTKSDIWKAARDAALVRSKLPIGDDVREALVACRELALHCAELDHPIIKQVDAAITAIGSQSIEGERG